MKNRPSNPEDPHQSQRKQPPVTPAQIADAECASEQVGVDIDELAAIYLLDSVKYLGPQAFKELHEAGSRPLDALKNPESLPTKGKRGDKIRKQLILEVKRQDDVFRTRAVRQILAAQKCNAQIVTYRHPAYPRNVYESNYPTPVLYVRGSLQALETEKTVACVGTRKIRPPYTEWEAGFVRLACSRGFTIVSGFALGADSIGHKTAWNANGATICVMPGGLDRPFPPENRDLWTSLLDYPSATFVTESPFGTSASSLTLRKRNKLIVAFSRGVLVAQSSAKGGAMNAYRFAIEQRKPVATFQADDSADTGGNSKIPEYENALVLKSEPEAYERWLIQLFSSI